MSKVALTLAALITAASVVSSPALAGSHINILSVRSTVPPFPPKHITPQAMGRDEVKAYIAAYKYGQWLAQMLHDNGEPPPE